MYIYMCIYIYIKKYTCVYPYTCIHIFMYLCIHMHVCMYIHVTTHALTLTHTSHTCTWLCIHIYDSELFISDDTRHIHVCDLTRVFDIEPVFLFLFLTLSFSHTHAYTHPQPHTHTHTHTGVMTIVHHSSLHSQNQFLTSFFCIFFPSHHSSSHSLDVLQRTFNTTYWSAAKNLRCFLPKVSRRSIHRSQFLKPKPGTLHPKLCSLILRCSVPKISRLAI